MHLVALARVEHSARAPAGERHRVTGQAGPHQITGRVLVLVAEMLGTRRVDRAATL